MKQKLLTTREVSRELGLSEKEVIDLAQSNKIPHFRIGGEFFRFKRDDLLQLKPKIKKNYGLGQNKRHSAGKVREFVYFNDFYIGSALLIFMLLWLIVKDFV